MVHVQHRVLKGADMTAMTRDVGTALIVGVAFLVIALAFRLSMPTLAILPVATSLIFLAARVIRRRRSARALRRSQSS